MIGRLLAAEWLKLRRTMLVLLVLLGPFGVVSLTAVNYGLRYDYMVTHDAPDLWGGLLTNISSLTSFALLLGAALVASMLAGYEHRTSAWKQLLAMPVTRFSVFMAKFLMSALLLTCCSTILAAGTYLLGGLLGFGWRAPVGALLRVSYFPMLAAQAIAALQLWLSVIIRNQAIPLTAGIVGTIVGLYGLVLPNWVLWKWPMVTADWAVAAGVSTGLLLTVMAAIHFNRKDVA